MGRSNHPGGRVILRLVAASRLGCGPNRLCPLLANTRCLLMSIIPVGICFMPWGLTGLPACGSMAHSFSHLGSRGRKGADAQVLLQGNKVTERRRISLGRNPEPLVPQRRRQLMPSRHWQGMRGIGCAQGAEADSSPHFLK
jgi:hypothetical protein